MKIITILLSVGVMGGCVLGVITIVGGMASATTAIQEAVVVALGIAMAVIPYCFARAFEMISRADK